MFEIETDKFSKHYYYIIQLWTYHNCPTFVNVILSNDNKKLKWQFTNEADAVLFALRW